MTLHESPTPEPQSSDRSRLEQILSEISSRLVIPSSEVDDAAAAKAASQASYIQMMTFRLGELSFGLEISVIDEVLRDGQFTRIPGAPKWLIGLSNFHGEIISVVNLSQFFGITPQRNGKNHVVLIAHAGEQRIGLEVDSLETIYTAPVEQIASPSFPVDAVLVPYLRGAVEHNGRFIRLLHGDQLLLGQQMQQFS